MFSKLVSLSAILCLSFGQNPFAGKEMYVNPAFVNEVNETIKKYPQNADILSKAAKMSSAYWIDKMAKIPSAAQVLAGAKAYQQKKGNKIVTMFVVYDLPDRDCAALASNGEILCQDNACATGLNTYKTKYIDPIVKVFQSYPDIQIVAIIEPDSLPNLATNLDMPKCTQAQNAYLTGVAYAIKQLSALPNVAMYVDAAHGGWLGWPNNLQKAAAVFSKVLQAAGGANKIRGFSTNVANYQMTGSMSSTADPCRLESQGNKAINEVKYISLLEAALSSAGMSGMKFVIDTSRNGQPNTRSDCSNWCNIKGSGLGLRPSTDTTNSGSSLLDAYIWVKTPGESDGTSDSSSPRFDQHCASADSVQPAPEAGDWFPSFFLMLCKNANPPL